MKHSKSPIATGFSSGHKEFSNKCTFCLDEMLPKGTVLVECGKMLEKGGYVIKSLNTINFRKSMHYNRATCSPLKRWRTALFQSVL